MLAFCFLTKISMQKIKLVHRWSFLSPNQKAAYVLFSPEKKFEFVEGQFLLLEKEFDGETIKRPYSIATAYYQLQKENLVGTIVKEVEGGKMSPYLVR